MHNHPYTKISDKHSLENAFMVQLHFRKLWPVSTLVLSLACASTTLEVPPETAANPEAATMPVAGATPALRDDFDPWATERAHEGHEGHEAAPSSEGHEGHEGHEAAPSSEGHEGHEAAPSSEGHEGHHHD